MPCLTTFSHVLILAKDNYLTWALKVKAYIAPSDYVGVIRRGILFDGTEIDSTPPGFLTNVLAQWKRPGRSLSRVAVSRMTQQAHPLTSPDGLLSRTPTSLSYESANAVIVTRCDRCNTISHLAEDCLSPISSSNSSLSKRADTVPANRNGRSHGRGRGAANAASSDSPGGNANLSNEGGGGTESPPGQHLSSLPFDLRQRLDHLTSTFDQFYMC